MVKESFLKIDLSWTQNYRIIMTSPDMERYVKIWNDNEQYATIKRSWKNI